MVNFRFGTVFVYEWVAMKFVFAVSKWQHCTTLRKQNIMVT